MYGVCLCKAQEGDRRLERVPLASIANKKAGCQGPEPQYSGGLTFQEEEGENDKG